MYRRVSYQDSDEPDEPNDYGHRDECYDVLYDLSDFRDVIEPTGSWNRTSCYPAEHDRLRQQAARYRDGDFANGDDSTDAPDGGMDERDSIYLDAVSVYSDATNRKSLHLSRQTVYHSAEDVRFGSVDSGSGSGADQRTAGGDDGAALRLTTEALLQDSRSNGGLANLPYVPRPAGTNNGAKGFISGILKPTALSTEYNEKVPSASTSSYSSYLPYRNDYQHGSEHDRTKQIVTYTLWKSRVNVSLLHFNQLFWVGVWRFWLLTALVSALTIIALCVIFLVGQSLYRSIALCTTIWLKVHYYSNV
uniref:Uncharacterized protein n=1 Tax=Anopheles maculatus TaxID=74869 RepID=A0A182TB37_9DIPT